MIRPRRFDQRIKAGFIHPQAGIVRTDRGGQLCKGHLPYITIQGQVFKHELKDVLLQR